EERAGCTKMCSQAVHGAADPHFGGGFTNTESEAHVAHGFLTEEAKQDGLAVIVGQAIQRIIESGSELLPGVVRLVGFLHKNGLMFAVATASFGAPGINGDVDGGAMEPGGQF